MSRITWVLYAARVPSSLPLFPLNTVLVPGLVMPLHIFEPRYRHMVSTLLELPDEDDREFGIIAVRQGRDVARDGLAALYPVGCATTIRQSEVLDDGRYDIVTIGSRRFRILSIDTSMPLITAEVEFLEDVESPDDLRLARRAARIFRAYRAILGDQVTDDEDADDAIQGDLTDLDGGSGGDSGEDERSPNSLNLAIIRSWASVRSFVALIPRV
jgi:Lon protease-like protein